MPLFTYRCYMIIGVRELITVTLLIDLVTKSDFTHLTDRLDGELISDTTNNVFKEQGNFFLFTSFDEQPHPILDTIASRIMILNGSSKVPKVKVNC